MPTNNSDHHSKSKQQSNMESSSKVSAFTDRAKKMESPQRNYHDNSKSTKEKENSSESSQMRAPHQQTPSFSFDFQSISQTESNSPCSYSNLSQAQNSHGRSSVELISSASVPHGNLSRPHSNHTRASVHHSNPPSRANSNHKNTGKRSIKSDKSGRRQSAIINANTTTEELLIQVGEF